MQTNTTHKLCSLTHSHPQIHTHTHTNAQAVARGVSDPATAQVLATALAHDCDEIWFHAGDKSTDVCVPSSSPRTLIVRLIYADVAFGFAHSCC